ncbi:MAG: tRNA-dihydrouridine synthase [Candidatus Levybacteria bacterium]|nr:tRNA-dihydrouridine synthase [Candidatus Levybacteria bacterium]
MNNFWQKIKKPFLVQAPMDDVTDVVFRQILADVSRPDVFFTEFTNTDSLNSKGLEKTIHRLKFTEKQHPIVAQIWGNKPENYLKTAKLLKKLGFDGIDINMGCPDRVIVKKGCCSGLINNPQLAKEIILATKEGADGLAVSVKTRLGYDNLQTQEWISFLLENKLDALTVHGRIALEMSKYPADWEEIAKAVKIRNATKSKTIIIGNGDVKTIKEAHEKHEKYGVDGIMIGRGIFTNLWVFDKNINPENILFKEKLKLLLQHIELFKNTWGNSKNFEMLKKYYKIYISGVENAQNIRTDLMKIKTIGQTKEFILDLIKTQP